MTRETFIKQLGIVGASTLVGTPLFGSIAHKSPGDTIGLGIIGSGDRGKGIMSLIQASGQGLFRIEGYCDILDFRLDEAARHAPSSAKRYTDHRHLLENKKIKAVLIAVPLFEHFRIAKDALLAGKHVYLEKTMTYSIEEALELVKIVEQHPRQTFQVGYQYRAYPLYAQVKEMINSGYLGKVSQIECRWDRNNNWRRQVPDESLERQINWRMYREYSGGLAAELLSHQMDFIHWAFDTQPTDISGFGGIDVYKDGRETYDNIQIQLRYENEGMIGNFGSTLGSARDGYLFRIKGSNGTVALTVSSGIYYPEDKTETELTIVDGVSGATKIVQQADGGIPIESEKYKDGTYYALNEFHRCIHQGALPLSNIYTGTKGAICTALANEAIYSKTVKHWLPEYNPR